ncbi:hypothetical protein Tco_1512726 [Tanacetum coccineum]
MDSYFDTSSNKVIHILWYHIAGYNRNFLELKIKQASDSLDSSRIGLLPSGRVDLTGDEDPTDEDGDIGMGDSTGVLVSLGGGISSGGKKSQELNIGGSDNCGDGGTRVGGGIVTCGGLIAPYACITFI